MLARVTSRVIFSAGVSVQSLPPYPPVHEQLAVQKVSACVQILFNANPFWSEYTHLPFPLHSRELMLGHSFSGTAQTFAVQRPCRHWELTLQAAPIGLATTGAVALKQSVLALPGLPLNPVRHEEHVCAVAAQGWRFRDAQYCVLASVQFT
jgi:hypothetical protein